MNIILVLIFEICLIILLVDILWGFITTREEKNTLIARGDITIDDKNRRKVRLCTRRLRVQKEIRVLREELNTLNIEIENAKVGK